MQYAFHLLFSIYSGPFKLNETPRRYCSTLLLRRTMGFAAARHWCRQQTLFDNSKLEISITFDPMAIAK